MPLLLPVPRAQRGFSPVHSAFTRHPVGTAISTWHRAFFPLLLPLPAAVFLTPGAASANLAGGTTGSGPDVTAKDYPDGTVTLANGIVAIVIVKDRARLNSVTYTCNNSGTFKTTEMLQSKGQYYYGGFSLGSGVFTYTLATDPAKNGGNYADVMLLSDSEKAVSWKPISPCCAARRGITPRAS